MNLYRRYWLRMRHFERAFGFYARAGKYGLAEQANQFMHIYRDMLGLPCTKGLDP